LAATIKSAKGIDAELIPGKGGIFSVEVNGREIYNKLDTLKFSTDDEILEQL